MAIEVRIPTILRPFTDGERAVDGKGATVAELIEDLEANHAGIKERLVEDGEDGAAVRRFVNVYVNDEDIRFTGGLGTAVADGDTVVILPAVAGGALLSGGHAAAVGGPRFIDTAVAGG
jgi:molybdopterin synthase sulfur carrier subunit